MRQKQQCHVLTCKCCCCENTTTYKRVSIHSIGKSSDARMSLNSNMQKSSALQLNKNDSLPIYQKANRTQVYQLLKMLAKYLHYIEEPGWGQKIKARFIRSCSVALGTQRTLTFVIETWVSNWYVVSADILNREHQAQGSIGILVYTQRECYG